MLLQVALLRSASNLCTWICCCLCVLHLSHMLVFTHHDNHATSQDAFQVIDRGVSRHVST